MQKRSISKAAMPIICLVAIVGVVVFFAVANANGALEEWTSFLRSETKQEVQSSVEFKRSSGPVAEQRRAELESEHLEGCYDIEDPSGNCMVYDVDYLDLLFDDPEPTVQEIHAAIDNNPSIAGSAYEEELHSYVDAYVEAFPNATMRILHANLKDMEIETGLSEAYMRTVTAKSSTEGAYGRRANKLYISTNAEKGGWSSMQAVVFHELFHASRHYISQGGSCSVEAVEGPEGFGVIDECFAANVTDQLLGKDARAKSYRLFRNCLDTLLECVGGYSVEDYVNHGTAPLFALLDEQSGSQTPARTALQECQKWFDYVYGEDEDISDDDAVECGKAWFTYIAEAYFNAHPPEDESEEAALAVADELKEKLYSDVSEYVYRGLPESIVALKEYALQYSDAYGRE